MPPTESQICWITGASAGIGAAVATRFAEAGWTVAASARGAEALEALAAETKGPGRIIPVVCDTTDRDAVHAAVARIEAEVGPIHIAILNAGTHQPVTLDSFETAHFRKLIEVNQMGTVHCVEALLPVMRPRGASGQGGQIAVVASIAGYMGLKTSSAYGMTKAGLINFAEALEGEMHKAGLAMRLICPGFVRTPLTDKNEFKMPFLMEADAAADRVFRGLTESRRFEITFPRRFTWQLKLLRALPYWATLPLTRKIK